MSTSLVQFNTDAIRVVEVDGCVWFGASDIASALGYANPLSAVDRHCRGIAKRAPIVDALGRSQEIRVISEPDVTRLIISSKMPAAERFERWVFEEVLPTIRKTGGYRNDPLQLLDDPEAMRALLLGYTERLVEARALVATQAPKAAALDRLANSGSALCLRDAAKTLQVPPTTLNNWLLEHKWIFRQSGKSGRLVGFENRVKQGVILHKSVVLLRDGSDRTAVQPMITPKGLAELAKQLEAEAAAAADGDA